jgi:hypothetical protein
MVGDELEIFEADGLVLGELGVECVAIIGDDDKLR